jgi:hypothetical protein
MATDRLTQAVRQRLGIGRLLTLGPPEDGTWIAERAAAEVLRRAVAGVAGVRVDGLRLAGPDAGAVPHGPVPAPASALPPGPARLEARCALGPEAALPAVAAELRGALTGAAAGRLGLLVGAVDVHVTQLWDGDAGTAGPAAPTAPPAFAEPPAAGAAGVAGSAARAAVSVPGVPGLAPVLGGALPTVRESAAGHHVQVEIAVAENLRVLDVARTVRAAVHTAVAAQTGGPVTVALVVTAVTPA